MFERMGPFQIEADCQLLNSYLRVISRLVRSANDSFFKNNLHDKITPGKLWTLILQCSALLSSCESVTEVLHLMKFLSNKNQECNQHSSVQKVEDFNAELLKKFVASYQLKASKLIAKEDDVDDFFKALVTCLWQFLRSDLSSRMAKNWHFILESFSSFADSYIICNQRHLNFFKLTTSIYRVFYLIQPTSQESFCAELQSLLSSLKNQRKQGKSSAFIWVLYSSRCAVNALETFAESAACTSFLTPRTLSSIFNFVNLVSEVKKINTLKPPGFLFFLMLAHSQICLVSVVSHISPVTLHALGLIMEKFVPIKAIFLWLLKQRNPFSIFAFTIKSSMPKSGRIYCLLCNAALISLRNLVIQPSEKNVLNLNH